MRKSLPGTVERTAFEGSHICVNDPSYGIRNTEHFAIGQERCASCKVPDLSSAKPAGSNLISINSLNSGSQALDARKRVRTGA